MVQFSPRWVLTQVPEEVLSPVPHCQVTTLSTAPCRIDLATGLGRFPIRLPRTYPACDAEIRFEDNFRVATTRMK